MSLSVSMESKRSKLASEIETILNAHDYAAFKVEQRIRQLLLDGTGEGDRDQLMGDPIAYCRIAHTGNDPEGPENVSPFGAVTQTPHQFAVFVWFQFRDNDKFAESSQQQWDNLIESHGDDAGLLHHLRETGEFVIEETIVYVGNPTQVIVPDEPLHMGEQTFAHYLQFFITIT